MVKAIREELDRLMGYLPEERGLYPKVKVSEQIIYLAELEGSPVNKQIPVEDVVGAI